jgi:inorganic pyrophosphatase/exopolyphosphatase
MMDKVYIFGHRKPDTDSVCGAISLSYLKNKLVLIQNLVF